MPKYWLMKSEPDVYSIDQLEKDGSTCWEGVRNYSARNHMQAMAVGDRVLFYHSNAKPPGVAGIAEVVKEAYPDHYAWKKGSKYFDEKSTKEKPRWFMVDVGFIEKLPREVSLVEVKTTKSLADMVLVKMGRLSVQPVTPKEFQTIIKMAGKQAP